MLKDSRFCAHCHYAISGLEFRLAIISFPCPDCGHVTGNHMAKDFYSYGSYTHKQEWEKWIALPEDKRTGRGPLPFPGPTEKEDA